MIGPRKVTKSTNRITYSYLSLVHLRSNFSLCVTGTRAAGLMAIFAEHRSSDLRLERNGVVLSAVVANDLKSCSCVRGDSSFLRTAFRTSLWRHHISLVKKVLLFLGKEKDLAALYTGYFDIGHRSTSSAIRFGI